MVLYNRESIRYMYEKLKSLVLDDTLFGVVMVVLVGIGSFGLGRLSVQENTPVVNSAPAAALQALTPTITPAVATQTLTEVNEPPQPTGSGGGAVVASRSGTKYHLPSCPGAKQIKPDNRIEFATPAAAEAAGYTPAANCPGLQ